MPQPVNSAPTGQMNGVLTAAHIDLKNFDARALAFMAATISAFSNVEAAQMQLYVQMLGGRQSTATATYMALDGKSSKTAAINAAAATVLTKDGLEVLASILKHWKSISKFRDMLAHWQLCYAPKFVGHLTLRDPVRAEHLGQSPFDGVYKFSVKEMAQHIAMANECATAFSCLLSLIDKPPPWKGRHAERLAVALSFLAKPSLLRGEVDKLLAEPLFFGADS